MYRQGTFVSYKKIMENSKELNDIELEKVTGGVNDNDVSEAKELISQLINALSSINETSGAPSVINKFNDAIEYLDQNRLDDAKKAFEDGIWYLNSIPCYYDNVFIANCFSDKITYIRVAMNW